MSRTTRPASLSALALVAGLMLALLLPAASASAAAYRYWGYFQLKGDTWGFATKGPDQTKPADGAVEGWRFAVGTAGTTRLPRVSVTFDDICGDTKAKAGKKRVAVVIDYGRKADTADNTEPPAPVGRCASVAQAATGAEVLGAIAQVRTNKSLVCSIDSFPATGCGEEVKVVSAAAKAPDTQVTLAKPASSSDKAASDSSDDNHTGLWVTLGVVVAALAALGTALVRRRGTPA